MAKKGKAKARKRVATKDLAPKDLKQVKGGSGTVAGFIPGAAVVSAAISGAGGKRS